MRLRKSLGCAIFAAVAGIPLAAVAQEPERNTPYFEDDAWYDVTEWFDGNDYNPTDEAAGRWDNERFQFSEHRDSSDVDDEAREREAYGYDSTSDADSAWFYDYYDSGDSGWYDLDADDDTDVYVRYYDSDDDGLYDSAVNLWDTDGDGVADRREYHTYHSSDSNRAERHSRDDQKNVSMRAETISGTIQEVKTARSSGTPSYLVLVKNERGNTVVVDLGTPSRMMVKPEKGTMIQATGHQLSIGDKKMFAATRVTLGGSNTIDINRSGRVYEGTVASTKKAKVRGQEHLLVKLETYDDKMLLADLGPAEKLSGKIKQGAEVTLHGILVRSKERVVLLTREVDLGDETVQIQQHQNRS